MSSNLKEKLIKLKNKYLNVILLIVVISILFLIANYSENNKDYTLFLDGKDVELKYGIYVEDEEQYIHVDDLVKLFEDNIYYDKLSAKLIITTDEGLSSISKDNIAVVKDSGNIYYNVTEIANKMGLKFIRNSCEIYLSSFEEINGEVFVNRSELFNITSKDTEKVLAKRDKVKILVNENLLDENCKIANIVFEENNNKYYGYILKTNIKYEYEHENQIESVKEKITLVKARKKLYSSTDISKVDIVAINMLRLSGVDKVVELDYVMPSLEGNIQKYGIINNGQTSANYDSDIISQMFNSSVNREKVINNIFKFVEDKKLNGVVVDFSHFKTADEQLYVQFIKELSAKLHANNKKIIVNIFNVQSSHTKTICNVSDYIIVKLYGEKSTASKVSGPTASVNYVENIINKIIENKIDVEKTILEISTTSVLWTERKGTVINAEEYDMKAVSEYIKLNGIDLLRDEKVGQNYINYTKGITTYKMWLEDEYSIKLKTELIKKHNFAGISIYESGNEEEKIYSVISEILNK